MTRHSIDDYGHTTQTVPAMITDEWAAQHLPLTQVALAAAVPLIEAEVREKVAREIEGMLLVDEWPTGWNAAIKQAALIARNPGWADA